MFQAQVMNYVLFRLNIFTGVFKGNIVNCSFIRTGGGKTESCSDEGRLGSKAPVTCKPPVTFTPFSSPSTDFLKWLMWIAVTTLKFSEYISPRPWPANSTLNSCMRWWRGFHTQHRCTMGAQSDLKLSPQPQQPSIKPTTLLSYLPSFLSDTNSQGWIYLATCHIWQRTSLYLPPPPPPVKYNAFNSPVFALPGFFFFLFLFFIWSRDRDQCVCSSWPKAKGSFWYNPQHRSDFVYSNIISLPCSN